eukprot:CAMPEP_0114554924 /NCGR_PEP_ID=MMETSP0114-20121206/8471_1 /TAXON_ID=31324 /ORGANISM="Goniomonas sp, Strain m" /LENGTH=370 /DNA_ID=CAMNT_0001740007 /DNA_START=54 /DNA_END=1166 /DNA_ORIENTATION=+
MSAWLDGDMDGFEGPEKRLEIDFETPATSGEGLRVLPKQFWVDTVALLRGSILDELKTEHFDAYLISESSLFVYPYRVIMITCGTTTLLNTLPQVILAGKQCKLRIDWVQYSRKNFIFPSKQIQPHTSFDEEVRVLKKQFPEGSPYVLGPLDSDHWFVFMADYIDRAVTQEKDQFLNIYMHDLDEEISDIFLYGDGPLPSAEEVTQRSGIDKLVPGSTVQAHVFDPCGYSINGILGESYFTIHVTPESHCSYASFETNLPLTSYDQLINSVLAVFRPRRAQTIILWDEGSRLGPAKPKPVLIPGLVLKNTTVNECEPGYKIEVVNYRTAKELMSPRAQLTPQNGSPKNATQLFSAASAESPDSGARVPAA